MKRTLLSAAAIAFLLSFVQPAAAEDLASSIVGTWKMTSFIRKEMGTGKTVKEYGEQPVGYNMYTKGGRLLVFAVVEGRKAPANPAITDAERLELFNTMFAYSGTYKVESNNKLVYSLDGSWNQLWTGRDVVRQAEIVGNKLTLVSPTFKNPDGHDVVVTSTFERVE